MPRKKKNEKEKEKEKETGEEKDCRLAFDEKIREQKRAIDLSDVEIGLNLACNQWISGLDKKLYLAMAKKVVEERILEDMKDEIT